MPSLAPVVFLDSCVYISHIKGEANVEPLGEGKPRSQICTELFQQISRGDLVLAASPLVVVEALAYHPQSDGGVSVVRKLKNLVHDSRTRYVEISSEIAELCLDLGKNEFASVQRRPKGSDLIHLASAILLRSDYFMTFDANAIDYGRVRNVEVAYPHPVGQVPLSFM